MTACPIRYQRQVSDRKGKIFYTSITSLSHISKCTRIIFSHHYPTSLILLTDTKNAADYQLHFLISYHVICFISVLQQLQSQPLRLLEVLLLQKLPTSSWSLTSLFCHVLYSPLF